MRFIIAALVAGLLFSGCKASESAKCLPLGEAKLASIAEGLKVEAELLRGAAVELPEDEQDLGIEYAAAVEVESDGDKSVVILGLSDAEPTTGMIMASDHVARLYFTWGDAAQDGSRAGNLRDRVFLTDAAKDAKRCLS